MNSVRSDQNLSILSEFISSIFSSHEENLIIFDQSFLNYSSHVRKILCSSFQYKQQKLKNLSISEISIIYSSKIKIIFLLKILMLLFFIISTVFLTRMQSFLSIAIIIQVISSSKTLISLFFTIFTAFLTRIQSSLISVINI